MMLDYILTSLVESSLRLRYKTSFLFISRITFAKSTQTELFLISFLTTLIHGLFRKKKTFKHQELHH